MCKLVAYIQQILKVDLAILVILGLLVFFVFDPPRTARLLVHLCLQCFLMQGTAVGIF